jgi:DUF1680 family protein
MPGISRRDALRLGALAAAVPAVLPGLGAGTAAASTAGSSGAAADFPAAPPTPAGWIAQPFANTQVTLGQSLFTANRDRILTFARSYPADRMLSIFRANAGLDTLGAQPPGGWETADGNLRGHYAGHFLSCLALAYAGTGEAVFKDKLDYMVTALGECQDALAATVGGGGTIGRVPGRFGDAVRLKGSSQHVALPAGILGGLTAVTIAMWVNPSAISSWSRCFDFGTGTTRYLFLAASTGANTGPRFGITTGGSGGEQRINATQPLPTGKWTHLAVTLADGTGTLYVDGVPVAANPAMTLTPASLGATTNNWIGRSQFGDPYLNAAVDEFQIFDRALTAAEVQALTTAADGGLGGGNVAWYRFDESDGKTAVDSSGHDRAATIVDPATVGVSHPGYLAAYPETQYILLEQYATYPTVWAPWYTCHMIMRGLLDAYYHTGNAQALRIVLGMADWAYSRLGHLPRAQLDRMWQIYIAGEYNAMPVVLAELHGLTGNPNHLVTAKAFDNTYLLTAAIANQDTINGKHANQHIPQYRGYLEIFDRTGERDYYTAAANFWDMVVPHRIYTDGGMAGSGEIFGARDVISATIQTANAETCPCYNMLHLSRSLFFHTADPKYMQYYERALYGQILASRQNVSSTTNPLLTYFVPVNPGARRSYGNLGTCCGGTGLESHTKFQDSIYFRSVDGSTLYVNLYLASTLEWPERGLRIEQSTGYPADPSGTTTLTVRGGGRLDIKLRVPYWVERGFQVKINGVEQPVSAVAGTYVTLSRQWSSGDTIAISMPFSLRIERALDNPAIQSIAYGPIPMVIQSTATSYRDVTLYRDLKLDADLSRAIKPTGDPNTFTTNGYPVVPFSIDDTNAYHAYFRRAEPEIVFGALDTGVANHSRADGLTFLDLVWSQAPFADQSGFVRAVREVSAEWLRTGLFTRQESQAVETAAARSNLRP